MILLRLYFLLVFMTVYAVSISQNMVIIWGALDQPNSPESWTAGNWKGCIDKCLKEQTCVLSRRFENSETCFGGCMDFSWTTRAAVELSRGVHASIETCLAVFRTAGKAIRKLTIGCEIFRFNKISSVKFSNNVAGARVGIKLTMDTCAGDASSAFGLTRITEQNSTSTMAFLYHIAPTIIPDATFDNDITTQLNFTFEYYIECPATSFASIRGANAVCIEIRTFAGRPWCDTQDKGVTLCTKNGIGLTGPYSTTELKTIVEYITENVENDPANINYKYYDFWVDGKKQVAGSTVYLMTDDTLNGVSGYGSEPLPDSPSCAYAANVSNTAIVNFHDCNDAVSKPHWCLRGAVCRVNPITQL